MSNLIEALRAASTQQIKVYTQLMPEDGARLLLGILLLAIKETLD